MSIHEFPCDVINFSTIFAMGCNPESNREKSWNILCKSSVLSFANKTLHPLPSFSNRFICTFCKISSSTTLRIFGSVAGFKYSTTSLFVPQCLLGLDQVIGCGILGDPILALASVVYTGGFEKGSFEVGRVGLERSHYHTFIKLDDGFDQCFVMISPSRSSSMREMMAEVVFSLEFS